MWGWLENTSVAEWVNTSLWAYPFWLSLHVIGLAMVAGIFLVRDLRLLGLFEGLDPRLFVDLGRVALVGFVVNAASGLFLFVAQASTFVSSTPFLVKISCIAIGLVVARVIQSRLRTGLAAGPTRLLAVVSLMSWVAAIVAGRLIAYV
jgi:hypothetical protein